MSMPTVPPAPARLSMMICWPHAAASFCATARAVMSAPPPGATGTIRRIGLSGYAAAANAGNDARSKAVSAALRITVLLGPAGVIGERELVEPWRVADVLRRGDRERVKIKRHHGDVV